MMMVQIIKENRGKRMFYPTDNTADITEIKKLGWEPTIDVLEYIKKL